METSVAAAAIIVIHTPRRYVGNPRSGQRYSISDRPMICRMVLYLPSCETATLRRAPISAIHSRSAEMVISAAVIIGREITLSALRPWMAGIGARRTAAVVQVGK